MNACVIMQNMTIESDQDVNMVFNETFDYQGPLLVPHQGVSAEFTDFLATHVHIHDETTHDQLRDDLVAPLWALRTHEQLDLYV